jgi:hypothetical protein
MRTEVLAHIAADTLSHDTYWNDDISKGGFIGCLTLSTDPEDALERFGLPVAVLRIAENVFDSLSDKAGKAFFAALPNAIQDGKDLSRVHWAFLAAELRALPAMENDLQAVIDPVIAGMELLQSGKEWPDADARSARAALGAAVLLKQWCDELDAVDAAIFAVDCATAKIDVDAGMRPGPNVHPAYANTASADYAATYAAQSAQSARQASLAATYIVLAALTAGADTAATPARQRDTLLALITAA